MSFDEASARKATEIAIGALPAIRDLTRVSGDKAQDALQTIAAIIESLLDGLSGKTAPDVVEAELQALVSAVVATDVNSKFDSSSD